MRVNTNNALQDSWDIWNTRRDNPSMMELLRASEPTISSAIITFAGKPGDPVVDLEARKLAVKAFSNYNPEKAQLSTYLYHSLKPLTRVVHNRARKLRMPQQSWSDLRHLQEKERLFMEEEGREPSVGELADLTSLSLKRVSALTSMRLAGVPESAMRRNTSEGPYDPEVLDEPTSFWGEAVYAGLGSRDQFIFDARLGAHGQQKVSNQEIAAKLKISPSAITQRVNHIISLLEEELS